MEGGTEDSLVEAAALAESWSKHPISLSIKAAYGKDIDAARVTDVEELAATASPPRWTASRSLLVMPA